MTKKDYELFANEIFNRPPGFAFTKDEKRAIVAVCITVFRQDNPTFQPDKFEQACYEGKHIRKSIKGGI